MKIEIKKQGNVDVLSIEIPVQPPATSKTGKTKIVASSGGFMDAGIQVAGKPVKLNLMATIPNN